MFKKYTALALGLSVITNHTFSSYKGPLIIDTAAIGGLTGYTLSVIANTMYQDLDQVSTTIDPRPALIGSSLLLSQVLTWGSLILFAVSRNKQGVALTGSYLLGCFLADLQDPNRRFRQNTFSLTW